MGRIKKFKIDGRKMPMRLETESNIKVFLGILGRPLTSTLVIYILDKKGRKKKKRLVKTGWFLTGAYQHFRSSIFLWTKSWKYNQRGRGNWSFGK